MPNPSPTRRSPPESAAHHALRGVVHTLFLAAVGWGLWLAMAAGEYAGFQPVTTGLIAMGIMLYISLVLDHGPPERYVPRPSPEGDSIRAWQIDQERQRAAPAVEDPRSTGEASPVGANVGGMGGRASSQQAPSDGG